jgi:hypothetical protein
MSAHLKPCTACSRHIRIHESSCPFCGAALAEAFHTPPQWGNAPGRLARAAVAALGVAAGGASALEGCVQSSSPVYGAPYDLDSDAEAGPNNPDADAEAGPIQTGPVYGAPFDPDAEAGPPITFDGGADR